MIPEENRFESDPEQTPATELELPEGWALEPPDGSNVTDVARLEELLRAHESAGRGWASASKGDVDVEVCATGLLVRENLVVRDAEGIIRAWGSVHDRSAGRMLYVHVIDRSLAADEADTCSAVLFAWAEAQALAVGTARGLAVQQIDTGAFADDECQHKWLEAADFNRVRTWWQMSRPVQVEEAALVSSPEEWVKDGVRFRLVRRAGGGLPDEDDLRTVHDVLESAFVDHFNSTEETFDEFVFRLREDPGHRWDHWWIAELVDGDVVRPAGALVGTESSGDPAGSYVSYIGVLSSARGRGVAKGLLNTIIADAAARGRNRVGLEVDADSPTGADGLYVGMGWVTRYVTESWHKDIAIPV